MNIAQLKAFVMVVDKGSFSAAARALGVSQPAVTMQIRSLEDDLGVTLINRNYRRLDLTEAGREMVPHSRNVLKEIDVARDRIATLSGVVSGSLLIASSTTPGVYLIPKLLGGFLRKHPKVDISISIQDSDEVVSHVAEATANIGITGARGREGDANFSPFAEDELVVIAHPSSECAEKFAGSGGIDAKELIDEMWIMRTSGSGTQQSVEAALAKEGLKMSKLNTIVELGTGEAIVNAVEGGLGIAMVSRYVAQDALANGSIVQIPLKRRIMRPFYIVLPKGESTAAAKAFEAYLRAQNR